MKFTLNLLGPALAIATLGTSAFGQVSPPNASSCWELSPGSADKALDSLNAPNLLVMCPGTDVIPNPDVLDLCWGPHNAQYFTERDSAESAIAAVYAAWDATRTNIQAQWAACVSSGTTGCDAIHNSQLCTANAAAQASLDAIIANANAAMAAIEQSFQACVAASGMPICVPYSSLCNRNLATKAQAPPPPGLPDLLCPDGDVPPLACKQLADQAYLDGIAAAHAAMVSAFEDAWHHYLNSVSQSVFEYHDCIAFLPWPEELECCFHFKNDMRSLGIYYSVSTDRAVADFNEEVAVQESIHAAAILACCNGGF